MNPAGTGQKSTVRAMAMEGLWTNNPIFSQVLGICSTLAVTNLVENTVVMCVGLIITLAMSSTTISILRHWTPRNIRMMVETLIIAFYVIVIDVILKAYWPEMSTNLGPYVGLIITNCIVMGRAESCANSQSVGKSFLDGVFNGVGYSFILLLVAIPRELLGMGSFWGIPMPYFSGPHFDKWIIMVMPPGAFFMLAVVIWIFRSIRKTPKSDTAVGAPAKGG